MSKKSTAIAALVGASALALAAALPAQAYTLGHSTLQEVPAPASGSCADYMSPADFNWAGVGASSWSPSFGDVCVRTVFYDNGAKTWYVR